MGVPDPRVAPVARAIWCAMVNDEPPPIPDLKLYGYFDGARAALATADALAQKGSGSKPNRPGHRRGCPVFWGRECTCGVDG